MAHSDLLQQAQQAFQSGEREQARRLLVEVLRANPRDVSAWLLMSQVVELPAHKLDCLMRVLAIEPENQAALAELARLNPQNTPGSPALQSSAPSTPAAPSVRVKVGVGVGAASLATRKTASPAEHLRNEQRRQRGYRNLMLAGVLIISMFCGLVLLTLTITQVVPRGQAIRRERLSVTPTPEPALYEATLWCPPCEQAGSPVILWEKVGDGISRGGKVGELPHNTIVKVHEEVWSAPEGRTYYRISAQGQRGWVPETFIRREGSP